MEGTFSMECSGILSDRNIPIRANDDLCKDFSLHTAHTCEDAPHTTKSTGEHILPCSREVDRGVRRICCIGAGFVGGTTGAIIALKNPHIHVTVVDLSLSRINAWNSENAPVFEPGLDAIVKQVRGCNLTFSTNMDHGIYNADIIFVCVGTSTKKSGIGRDMNLDLSSVEMASRQILAACNKAKPESTAKRKRKVVVEKSTVPCGTAQKVREILQSNASGVDFEVLSNPEFLAEGSAIRDLLDPDRVLIGSLDSLSGDAAASCLASIYTAWVPAEKIIRANLWSSELAKLASNALLAQRISSINAISAICEETGASVDEVSVACGLDKRLGNRYLKAGLGFGGSCFRKDVLCLVYLSQTLGLKEVADYWHSVVHINDYQKTRFASRIIRCLSSNLAAKRVAVLGFSYKPWTSDTREAPAIDLIIQLVAEGASVSVYDPVVGPDQILMELSNSANLAAVKVAPEVMKAQVSIETTLYRATEGVYATIIATEWEQFSTSTKGCDWKRIYDKMAQPAWVFDGRSFLDVDLLEEIGFHVESVGRQTCPGSGTDSSCP